MRIHKQNDEMTLWHGDCIEVMNTLPDNSVDSIVTDPPYGLGFMGKDWDDLPPGLDFAVEALRVLKPGGHLLAFGGTRTWHRLTVAVEDAGFEIRDSIAWLYGSGFPKSLDVGKAIAEARAAAARAAGEHPDCECSESYRFRGEHTPGCPADDGERLDIWDGWGTALKPSFEPIVVGRKPLRGTVAANVLAHGTGALNIGATRTATDAPLSGGAYSAKGRATESASLRAGSGMNVPGARPSGEFVRPDGRWPTNVVLDESQGAALDEQSGTLHSGVMRAGADRAPRPGGTIFGADGRTFNPADTYGDSGGASRFFPTFRYEAKAPTSERPSVDGVQHPTVKPLELMRWLVRLVTPKGGLVLEPFAGSGTTIEAALLEGFWCIGIEREESYLPLIEKRINKPLEVGFDFGDWDGAA